MNNREQRGSGFTMIGGSSLLVIFAVLALTIFALLSFSTVRAEERLSQVSAQAVQNYYAADCAAQEILSHLRAGEWVDGVAEQEEIYSYSCAISDDQILEVEVKMYGNGAYQVLRWQAVTRGDWDSDHTLPVWDGT